MEPLAVAVFIIILFVIILSAVLPAIILYWVARERGRSSRFAWWGLLAWIGLIVGLLLMLTTAASEEESSERQSEPLVLTWGHAVLAVVAVGVAVMAVWLFAFGGGDDDPVPASPAATATAAPAATTAATPAATTATPSPAAEATPMPAATEAAADEPIGVAGIETGVIDRDLRPEVGQPAPDFALANARAPDRVVRLSDFRGRPVVLNWFATWCGPCRAEIPDFKAAYEALGGAVVFLGINLEESAGDATGMLGEYGATYPALLDEEGAVALHYRLPGMPTTFFIDAEGVVRAWGAGLIVEETLVAELAKLGVDYEP